MARACPYLLCACLLAIAVLGILLGRARAASVEAEAALQQHIAIRDQALSHAESAISALEIERDLRVLADQEIRALKHDIDSITKSRPLYHARPRPVDAAGHRESILRAIAQ